MQFEFGVHTILNSRLRALIQGNPHSSWITPVFGVHLAWLEYDFETQNLDGVHNLSSKRIWHCFVLADSTTLGSASIDIKVDGIEALVRFVVGRRTGIEAGFGLSLRGMILSGGKPRSLRWRDFHLCVVGLRE